MSDLAAALMVAIRVHAGQVDKAGEPYLLHVLRVVEAVEGERAKILAALHDVLEENPSVDLEDLDLFSAEAMFIANSVEVLTRSPNETYAEYIESIRDGHSSTWVEECRKVKLADLRDNLGRIPLREDALEVEERPTLSGYVAIEVDGREGWDETWGSLKVRYEKAIETLEAATVAA